MQRNFQQNFIKKTLRFSLQKKKRERQNTDMESKYIVREHVDDISLEDENVINLIMIPQAGLGAWCYHGKKWNQLTTCLKENTQKRVRLIPIEMKGRNSRYNETALESVNEVVDEMMVELKPLFSKELSKQRYVLFGFSLGAWIAFELGRRLERDDACANPSLVACCGNRPNHLCSEYYDPDIIAPRIAQITDAKLFWKAFERRYGSNPEMTEDMKTRILPNIRSDFVQVETYDYKVTTEKYDLNERLESPMLCVAAKNDKRYHAMDFERWPELCSNNGKFRCAKKWIRGVDPNLYTDEDVEGTGIAKEYWGTPHRLIVDYPDELIAELQNALREIF